MAATVPDDASCLLRCTNVHSTRCHPAGVMRLLNDAMHADQRDHVSFISLSDTKSLLWFLSFSAEHIAAREQSACCACTVFVERSRSFSWEQLQQDASLLHVQQ
jgi:hypothetical protein